MDPETKAVVDRLGIGKPLSKQWTSEERIRIVLALLPDMQADIYAGCYSRAGRPNITSLQHILADTPEVLEMHRKDLEDVVKKKEAEWYPKES